MLRGRVRIHLRRAGENMMNTAVIQNQQRRRSADPREEIASAISFSQSQNKLDPEPVDLQPRPESDPEPVSREEPGEIGSVWNTER